MPGTPTKTESGWAWMIVLGAFIVNCITAGLTKPMGLINLQLALHFGISTSYASMPLIVAYIIYPVLAPVCIAVAEGVGVRPIVIFGGLAGTIGLALSSFLVNMPWFIFFFGVGHGLTCATSYGNSFIQIEKYFDKRIALANGLSLAGTSVGQFVIPILNEYLLDTYGFGGSMLIISGIYFNCCLSGALFRPVAQVPMYEERGGDDNTQSLLSPSLEPTTPTKVNSSLTLKADGPALTISDCCSSKDKRSTLSEKTHSILHCDSMNGVNKQHTIQPLPIGSNNKTNITETINGLNKAIDKDILQHIDMNRHRNEKENDMICIQNYNVINSKSPKESVERTDCQIVYELHDTAFEINVDGSQNKDVPVRKTTVRKQKISLTTKLKTMFDFSALRSYLCLHILIYSFVNAVGVFNFVIYIPGMLRERGIVSYDVAICLSVIGLGDLIGRLTMGTMGTFIPIARYKLKTVVCLLGGINMLLFFIAKPYAVFVMQCFFYGFFTGCYVCLMALVCFDFVDSKSAPKVFSLAYPTGALGIAIGQILFGLLKDATGSYVMVCVMCAICKCVGGICVFFLPVVSSRDKRKRSKQKTTNSTK